MYNIRQEIVWCIMYSLNTHKRMFYAFTLRRNHAAKLFSFGTGGLATDSLIEQLTDNDDD